MKELIRRLTKIADSSSSLYEPLRGGRESRRRPSAMPAEGHVPVYVGEDMERFEVRADLLSHPVFLELLQRSASEFGYDQRGVLRIPCPVPMFERVLDCLVQSDDDRRELPDEIRAEILQFLGSD